MSKAKRKLTQETKRKRRRREFKTRSINEKQNRGRREPTIDGIPVDEFILRNADPIWLHQNEMWEYIQEEPSLDPSPEKTASHDVGNDDLPF